MLPTIYTVKSLEPVLNCTEMSRGRGYAIIVAMSCSRMYRFVRSSSLMQTKNCTVSFGDPSDAPSRIIIIIMTRVMFGVSASSFVQRGQRGEGREGDGRSKGGRGQRERGEEREEGREGYIGERGEGREGEGRRKGGREKKEARERGEVREGEGEGRRKGGRGEKGGGEKEASLRESGEGERRRKGRRGEKEGARGEGREGEGRVLPDFVLYHIILVIIIEVEDILLK